MESSFTPLTSREIYEGCLTSSERSYYISESSAEPSLSPSSSAREYYEGLRTPDWLDTIGVVDDDGTVHRDDTIGDDGDSNGDGHGHDEYLAASRTSIYPQSGAHVTHIFSDDGLVRREGAVDLSRTFARPILLADQVVKLLADDVFRFHFKAECAKQKAKTEKVAALLWQVARADLYEWHRSRIIYGTERELQKALRQVACGVSVAYERPLSRIIDEAERALQKALTLVIKCCATNGILKRVFTIIPAAAFRKVTAQLENSIEDITWVLVIYASHRVDEVGRPTISSNAWILVMIWELIANLYTGSMDTKALAAASLLSLAYNDPDKKLILEEGGVVPLLRLIKEGRQDVQEDTARAIGILAGDPQSDERMILAGVGTVFAQILKKGNSMKLQSVVAWAISELASSHPKCQDHFAQNNITLSLVRHLIAFETDIEHSKGIELYEDDRAAKVEMKAMATRALWKLCKGNSLICRSITNSRALLCFAMLLEEGPGEVQYHSAMALMEIAAVAEEDADLRRSALNPYSSPAAKAVVDQLLRIVEKADSDVLVIPCIKAIGSLARTFRATETRMIGQLVKLLHNRVGVVMREAVIALTKFACTDNYLSMDHSKAILNAGGRTTWSYAPAAGTRWSRPSLWFFSAIQPSMYQTVKLWPKQKS